TICMSSQFLQESTPINYVTLSLHDALPILGVAVRGNRHSNAGRQQSVRLMGGIFCDDRKYHLPSTQIRQSLRSRNQLTLWWEDEDRKSTRLYSSPYDFVCRRLLEKKKY